MSYLRPSLVMLILLTLITGIAYPLLTTGLSQLLFSGAANGSLLYQGDKVVGSALIGQNFTKPEYFWGRPSATGRVAAARQLPPEQIAKLIDQSTDQATPNFMGESVVNVLKLNLALDALK